MRTSRKSVRIAIGFTAAALAALARAVRHRGQTPRTWRRCSTPASPASIPNSYIVVLDSTVAADADAAASRARALGATVDATFRTALRGYAATISPAALATRPRATRRSST